MAGNLTIPQLYDLAVQAGWPVAVAPDAAATAWVESSGDPAAASGTGPLGLWQIARDHAGTLGFTEADRLDPLKNAQMALGLWRNRGGLGVAPDVAFADWWPYDRANTRQQQNYAAALATAKQGGAKGVAPPDTPGVVGAVSGAMDSVSTLAKEFASFATMAAWFVNPANDIRVLLGIFGLLFLGAGAWMLGREVRHSG